MFNLLKADLNIMIDFQIDNLKFFESNGLYFINWLPSIILPINLCLF